MWDIDKEFFEAANSEKPDDFFKGTPMLDEIGKGLDGLMKDIESEKSPSDTEAETEKQPSMMETFKQ